MAERALTVSLARGKVPLESAPGSDDLAMQDPLRGEVGTPSEAHRPSRPPTPAGLGAARRAEPRTLDSSRFMRFLRQSTMAATKRMPRNSMARFHLALILHRLGDLGRAHVEFQRALECAKSWLIRYPTGEVIRDNARTRAFCARITVHIVRVAMEMQGDRFASGQTLEALAEAFRWEAAAPHAWNDLALMHLQAGECDAARIVLETVVTRWPEYVDAFSNLALALAGVGRPEAAVRCLCAVLVSSRSHVEALNNYAAMVIEEQHEPLMAVALLRSALEWDVTQPAVWSNLAVAFSRLGMHREASACLSRACDLAPEWEAVWLNAAALLVRAPAAMAAAANATASDLAATLAAAAGPGVVLEPADEPAGAGGDAASAPGTHAAEPAAAGAPAEACATPGAVGAGGEAASVAPGSRGRACLRAEDVEARIEAQAEILPDGRAWAALAATRLHRWEASAGSLPPAQRQEIRDECLKASAKALSIDEGNVAAWTQLGVCALHDGFYAKAQGYFLQMLSEQPRIVSGWCNLGLALQLGGKPIDAEKAYLRGLDLYPKSVQLLNNLGNLARQRGLWSKAEDYYFRALDVRPDYAMAYNNLGLLYIATGLRDKAADCLRRAAAMDPTLQVAQANLRRLEWKSRGGHRSTEDCEDAAAQVQRRGRWRRDGRGDGSGRRVRKRGRLAGGSSPHGGGWRDTTGPRSLSSGLDERGLRHARGYRMDKGEEEDEQVDDGDVDEVARDEDLDDVQDENAQAEGGMTGGDSDAQDSTGRDPDGDADADEDAGEEAGGGEEEEDGEGGEADEDGEEAEDDDDEEDDYAAQGHRRPLAEPSSPGNTQGWAHRDRRGDGRSAPDSGPTSSVDEGDAFAFGRGRRRSVPKRVFE